jgi:hypothetical protein
MVNAIDEKNRKMVYATLVSLVFFVSVVFSGSPPTAKAENINSCKFSYTVAGGNLYVVSNVNCNKVWLLIGACSGNNKILFGPAEKGVSLSKFYNGSVCGLGVRVKPTASSPIYEQFYWWVR